MLKPATRLLVVLAILFTAGCGYEAGATFKADGSVVISLRFLVPTALTQSGSGTTMSGMSPSDIAKANTELQAKYPGSKVATVTVGDETGAEVSIPFKTEKDAFAFLTQPSKLQSGLTATAGAIDLGNTGGMFKTATHTTSGSVDTYQFTTAPQPLTSASPGSQEAQQAQELASLFTVTFALTVPQDIISANNALFTQDRKTAIWKLSLVAPQTLTATTGPSSTGGIGLTANNTAGGVGTAVLVGVVLVAVGLGFLGGLVVGWSRSHLRLAPAPVAAAPVAPAQVTPASPPSMMAGPPSDLPPPAPLRN
jgi:hypothetical protein